MWNMLKKHEQGAAVGSGCAIAATAHA